MWVPYPNGMDTKSRDMNKITVTVEVEMDGHQVSAAIANNDELYKLDPRARLAILARAVKVLAEEHEHAKIAAYLAAASKPRRRLR